MMESTVDTKDFNWSGVPEAKIPLLKPYVRENDKKFLTQTARIKCPRCDQYSKEIKLIRNNYRKDGKSQSKRIDKTLSLVLFHEGGGFHYITRQVLQKSIDRHDFFLNPDKYDINGKPTRSETTTQDPVPEN